MMIEPGHPELSIQRQCDLVGLPRSTFYYEPRPVSARNLELMNLLDELYTRMPFVSLRQACLARQDRRC
jgi:putative transposase